MFNSKSKSGVIDGEIPTGNSASLIGAGTSMKGDITSNGDLRIDGILKGNIHCNAKVVIGANGVVEGDVHGQQADIMGKVTGTIQVRDLLQLKAGSVVNGNIKAGKLQLKAGSVVNGNIKAGKLQIEPAAAFNGECHMGTESHASSNGKASPEFNKVLVDSQVA